MYGWGGSDGRLGGGALSQGPGVKHNTQPGFSFLPSSRSPLSLSLSLFLCVRIPIWPGVALEY